MISPTQPLPDFENPPVAEVVLAVQFEPIPKFRTPQIGLLWQEFRDEFPETEEHPPLEPAIERFGIARSPSEVSFQMLGEMPTPRNWFINAAGTELIQVQKDRFIHNWRKREGNEEYRRYQTRRNQFKMMVGKLEDFLGRHSMGNLLPNQCEVTYINQIEPGVAWHDHSEMNKVFSPLALRYSDAFLGAPEDAKASLRFVIPSASTSKPLGRLIVTIDPVFRAKDGLPMFRLSLTARGQPTCDGIDGILGFLDIGHEWVVRGFASVTTPALHAEWSRKDVRHG